MQHEVMPKTTAAAPSTDRDNNTLNWKTQQSGAGFNQILQVCTGLLYTVTKCFGEIDKLYTPSRCLPSVFHLSSCDGIKNSTTPHVGKHVPTQSRTSRNSCPLQHAPGILQLPRKNNPHMHIVEFVCVVCSEFDQKSKMHDWQRIQYFHDSRLHIGYKMLNW